MLKYAFYVQLLAGGLVKMSWCFTERFLLLSSPVSLGEDWRELKDVDA